jgi:hypothetical protein
MTFKHSILALAALMAVAFADTTIAVDNQSNVPLTVDVLPSNAVAIAPTVSIENKDELFLQTIQLLNKNIGLLNESNQILVQNNKELNNTLSEFREEGVKEFKEKPTHPLTKGWKSINKYAPAIAFVASTAIFGYWFGYKDEEKLSKAEDIPFLKPAVSFLVLTSFFKGVISLSGEIYKSVKDLFEPKEKEKNKNKTNKILIVAPAA